MKRRNFIKGLLVGAVAPTVVVKVVTAEKKKSWRVGTMSDDSGVNLQSLHRPIVGDLEAKTEYDKWYYLEKGKWYYKEKRIVEFMPYNQSGPTNTQKRMASIGVSTKVYCTHFGNVVVLDHPIFKEAYK